MVRESTWKTMRHSVTDSDSKQEPDDLLTSDFSQMPEEASGSRFLRLFEHALLVALLALFIWHAFLPAWRTLNSDFPNYYLAASLYHRGIPLDRVYEWTWFQRQNDRFGVRDGIVGFAPNPPFCALPIAPLAALPPLAAKRVWLILSLFFMALSVWALQRVTTLGWRRVSLLSLLCIIPLHSNFLLGQFYVLVLLLICVAYYASRSGQPFVSGLLLAIAAMLKLFPALFLLLLSLETELASRRGIYLRRVRSRSYFHRYARPGSSPGISLRGAPSSLSWRLAGALRALEKFIYYTLESSFSIRAGTQCFSARKLSGALRHRHGGYDDCVTLWISSVGE